MAVLEFRLLQMYLFLKTGSHLIAQAALELAIFLPHSQVLGLQACSPVPNKNSFFGGGGL